MSPVRGGPIAFLQRSRSGSFHRRNASDSSESELLSYFGNGGPGIVSVSPDPSVFGRISEQQSNFPHLPLPLPVSHSMLLRTPSLASDQMHSSNYGGITGGGSSGGSGGGIKYRRESSFSMLLPSWGKMNSF